MRKKNPTKTSSTNNSRSIWFLLYFWHCFKFHQQIWENSTWHFLPHFPFIISRKNRLFLFRIYFLSILNALDVIVIVKLASIISKNFRHTLGKMRCLLVILIFALICVQFSWEMVLPIALKENPCHEEGSAAENTACANLCFATANKCGKLRFIG